jgi:hypothetical protein
MTQNELTETVGINFCKCDFVQECYKVGRQFFSLQYFVNYCPILVDFQEIVYSLYYLIQKISNFTEEMKKQN